MTIADRLHALAAEVAARDAAIDAAIAALTTRVGALESVEPPAALMAR